MTAPVAAPREVALDHYADRQRFVGATSEVLTGMWGEVNPDSIAASWAGMLPEATAIVAGAQLGAARSADAYADEALSTQDVDPTAVAAVDPAAFSGAAADGGGLMSLLANPVVVTLLAIQDGVDVARALGYGRTNLDMLARTMVADAGRLADQVALTARPRAQGYVRVAVGRTCARCLLLAGRRYEWNAGFKRHPMCDCIHLPTGVAVHTDLVRHPREIYNEMTRAERLRAGFTVADQRAIADGADIDQIVNVRHRPESLPVAGRRSQRATTTVGAGPRSLAGRRLQGSPRLTVDEIYRRAGDDRAEALRLLHRNGYLLQMPDTPIGGAVSVPAALPSAAAADPALKMSLAELKAIVRAHAVQVKVPLSFFGTKKADIVARLRDWERTYMVKISGLPVWKAPPAPRPGFEGVPPLAKPDPNAPPLTGAALNDWSDYFVHDQNSGRHVWVNAKGDTPPEGVRVENLRTKISFSGNAGYVVRIGTAWRFDGVSYLIEHSSFDAGSLWISRTLQELRAAHSAIPAARRINRSYTVVLGPSPDDAYWQARFRNPSHRAAMSAGNGHTTIWGFTPWGSRVDVDLLRHETGHSLDDAIGRASMGSDSPQWAQAARDDVPIATSVQALNQTDRGHGGLGEVEPGRAWPNGVTTYGRSSPGEDFAESVRLYQLGPIATGRPPWAPAPDLSGMKLPPSVASVSLATDPVLYFRDLYPHRAAILDGIFPDIARAQKAEIAALRALAKPVDISKMTVTQLRAQARAQGVKGYSRMVKADLIVALGGKAPAVARMAASEFTARAGRAQAGQSALDAPPVWVSRRSMLDHSTPDVRGLGRLTARQREQIIDAVGTYRGLGYKGINRYLRTGETVRGAKTVVTGIDRAMAESALSGDTVLWRGLRDADDLFGPRASWPRDLAGREFDDLAYVSTSAFKDVAARGGPILMRILAPGGTRAIKLSDFEAEVLLARGMRFRVVADHGQSDFTDSFGNRRTVERLLDIEIVPLNIAVTTDVASMGLVQLRALARDRKLRGYSRMTKQQLVDALSAP